ncbi:MAG: hypothetical protein ACRENE_20160, partial [Polyangiaceae bacterium]
MTGALDPGSFMADSKEVPPPRNEVKMRAHFALLLLGLLPSCASPSSGRSGDAAADSRAQAPCVSGQSIACAGPSSCAGFQVCRADGSGYKACICGPADGSAPDSGADGSTGNATVDSGDAASSDDATSEG